MYFCFTEHANMLLWFLSKSLHFSKILRPLILIMQYISQCNKLYKDEYLCIQLSSCKTHVGLLEIKKMLKANKVLGEVKTDRWLLQVYFNEI